MSGSQLRLGRLFRPDPSGGHGRAFITAFDHGVTLGVPEGGADALGIIAKIIAGEPDGVLLGPGLLDKASHLFAHRGAPAPIVRCDFIVNHPFVDDLGEAYRVMITPKDAVRLGAEAAVMFLMVGASDGKLFADNVAAVSKAAQEAHEVGLPLIVESVLWGSRIEDKKDPERLAFGARLAVELGADAVKTENTGDPETMRQIIDGTPAPVLLLGGSKSADPEALWKSTQASIDSGARGVIYGRNVWQADDIVAVSGRLREIIHSAGAPAQTA